MKLYDYTMAPNTRRVRMFLAEKGIEVPLVPVDLMTQEQLAGKYDDVNPRLAVPVLEFDDGTRITESVAICRYFEELHPAPALFGTGPLGKAEVEMWHRRVELEGMTAAADALRNSNPAFKGRAITGVINYPQIPELAERGLSRLNTFFDWMDLRLREAPFLAGDSLSIADIAAFVTVDFAKTVKKRIGEDQTGLARWYAEMNARPSARA